METKVFTLQDAINVQEEQLKKIVRTLSPDYAIALQKEVAKRNSMLTAQSDPYSVFRGQQLSEWVANYNPNTPYFDGMAALTWFTFNYPSGFIAVCFGNYNAAHFQSKFDGFYKEAGAVACMQYFIVSLTTDNQNTLYRFIFNAYNTARK